MDKQGYLKMVVVAAATLIASFSGAVSAAPVAVVTDVQGRATLPKESFLREVTVLAEIESDARVQLDDKARLVVVYYSSGAELTFRGPAVVQFKAAAPEMVSGSPPERRAVALAASGKDRIKPGGLARAAYMMMGAQDFLKLVSLSDTRTLEVRPAFRWTALEPVSKYEFRITGDAGRVVYATTTNATSLTLPADVSLSPDTRYTWRVLARLSDGTESVAIGEFSTVTAELRAQVEAARPTAPAALSQQVAFALWLEQLQLRDEARKIWEVARAQWPDNPRLEALATR